MKVRARGQEYDRFKARRALANKRAAPGAARAKANCGAPIGQGHADVQVRMGSWWPFAWPVVLQQRHRTC